MNLEPIEKNTSAKKSFQTQTKINNVNENLSNNNKEKLIVNDISNEGIDNNKSYKHISIISNTPPSKNNSIIKHNSNININKDERDHIQHDYMNNNSSIYNKNNASAIKNKELVEKIKLKNIGNVDDFSIEIETNTDIYENKNKISSKNSCKSININANKLDKSNSNNKNYNNNYNNLDTNNKSRNKSNHYYNTDDSRERNDNKELKSNHARYKTVTTFESLGNHKNLLLKSQKNTNYNNTKNNTSNNYNAQTNNNKTLTTVLNAQMQNSSHYSSNNIEHGKEKNLKKIEYPQSNISHTQLYNNEENSQSIYDENFNNSNINGNSEIAYKPCKTVNNMGGTNSRSNISKNNIKRNVIDDMDSIIYNNIQKLFDNNINTRQISKNNLHHGSNIKKLFIEMKSESNLDSKYIDESESYYDYEDSTYKENGSGIAKVNFVNNQEYNERFNSGIMRESDTNQNIESSYYKESSRAQEGEMNDSNIEAPANIKYYNRNNTNKNTQSYYYEQSSNRSNNKNINPNMNVNTNKFNDFYKNQKICNVKYINTNLNNNNNNSGNNKQLSETNAENTIKFGNSTEFRENIEFSESFMSNNVDEIGKFDIIIKNSNC